ncbi:unnamed protein product [Adineta steineri]|uniref:DUF5672 domain-containing protein n=1 Tax=Adineta steineri TaxID=433720 RepID=A0A819T4A8_9BILA|nr:unnamed protein product [Adineta steineri]CAF4073609.1 unnamed protein product [Adineta steineri]
MIHRNDTFRKIFRYRIERISVFLIFIIIVDYHINKVSKDFILLEDCIPNSGSSSGFNNKLTHYKNIAVIVESRSDPLLITIVLNVLQNIPESWPIQIFHFESNAQFINSSQLFKYIKLGKIILTKLQDYNSNYAVFTNTLLTNITFWKQIRGEKVLYFQLDSIMCSNSPHKISEYLKYDYIGAPWKTILPYGGNGGFSLRSKSKTLTLLRSVHYNGNQNEDIWYSIRFSNVGNMAPLNVSKTFAVETIYYDKPLAVHHLRIDKEDLKKLCHTCPEARLVPPYCM